MTEWDAAADTQPAVRLRLTRTERKEIKAKAMEKAEPMLTRVGKLRRVVPTAGPDLVFRRTTLYVRHTMSYVNLRYSMFR